MAKIIKYKIATEFSQDVVVKVPLMDEHGDQVVELVTPSVYDENGEIIAEAVYEPVFVEEIRPEIKTVLSAVKIKCDTEESLEANILIAQTEAYNGEYTVEGEFDRETETTDDILNALLGVTE